MGEARRRGTLTDLQKELWVRFGVKPFDSRAIQRECLDWSSQFVARFELISPVPNGSLGP